LSPQENTYEQEIENKESKEKKIEKYQKLDPQGRPSKVHKTDNIDKLIIIIWVFQETTLGGHTRFN